MHAWNKSKYEVSYRTGIKSVTSVYNKIQGLKDIPLMNEVGETVENYFLIRYKSHLIRD